jgi:hypothetical protein
LTSSSHTLVSEIFSNPNPEDFSNTNPNPNPIPLSHSIEGAHNQMQVSKGEEQRPGKRGIQNNIDKDIDENK